MKIELFCNGITLDDATWADVEVVLPELKIDAFFSLSIMPVPKSGPTDLEIQSENGNYMPLMGVRGGGGRALNNPAVSEADMIEIGGYDWDPTGITQDYDLIIRMIKEFYHTGNVSPELWKPPSK